VDREALNARLLQLFVDELDEHVQAMNTDLIALEEAPDDLERVRSLFRSAHTLKGAAHAAGISGVETACHSLEDLLAAVRDERRRMTAAEIELLFRAIDGLQDASRRLRAGEPLQGSPLGGVVGAAEAPGPKEVEGAPDSPPHAQPAPIQASDGTARPGGEARTVRIAPERLDDLLAIAGEFLGLARRTDGRRQEMEGLVDSAERWSREWRRDLPRLRAALDRAGASEAERETLASVEDHLRQLGDQVRAVARQGRGDARQMARVGDELTRQVTTLRMRPIQDVTETLPRVVRDLATSAGKEVHLAVEGAAVAIDRAVLDALREALLPIVRNAIDHGVERPEERERAGKPRAAELRVAAELAGDRVSVSVSDDGRGIDATVLRARFEAAGLPVPGDDLELAEALLGGGVSSRSRATTISGRGVGLDIVRSTMERVRGTVHLSWRPGLGTTVRLEFPPSLASVRALLVAVGSQVLGVPTASVERMARVPLEMLGSLEGRPVLAGPDGAVPVASLARVLGPPLVERPLSDIARLVIVAAGGQRAAFLVDDLLAEEELILRPIPSGRHVLALLAGASILGNGGVVPVIDTTALLAAARRASPAPLSVAEAARAAGPMRRLLVVDDSLTTRTLEQSVLEAAGYTVATAADGLDALRLLQTKEVDLVVSDVEMPRLDGFGLCEAVRASPRLRPIPVILLTARETPEDRARGMEAGADAYLMKSSFDQEELLATIEQLLG
jgi:two-component system chemotaxis sensor kinase CheA